MPPPASRVPLAKPGASASIVSIAEPGPSSVAVRRATSAATSLMRSRSSAFSTRSAAQVDFGVALERRDFALQLVAFVEGRCKLRFELGDVGPEFVGRAAAAACDAGEFAAQIAFDLAAGLDVAAQPVEFVIALGQKLALVAKPRFKLADAPREDFGLGGLHAKLPLEFGGAGVEAFELGARIGQIRRRNLRLVALARQACLGLLYGAFVVGDADLHRFGLRA